MADNTTLNAGSGGDVIASDDIASVKYPRSKISLGADGTATDAIGISHGVDSAGTGIQAVGVVGEFDDTSTSTVTENQFAPLRISSDRRLLVDAQIVGQDADITIADGGNAITVDGTVTANLSSTDNTVLDNIDSNTDYGAVTGGGVEASALRVTIASDSTGVVSVDDNGGALTVDGTVTANLSATDNAVLDTIASPVATISATPLQRVAIFDASDAQITSFGGGTQYTEGDTDASITGTAMLWEDAANTLATVSASKPLPVSDAGGALTVDNGGTFAVQAAQSGTWTVDLGATDNAVLDAIAASVAGTLTVGSHAVTNAGTFAVQAAQSGTWNITNVSGTVSLPTGAATSSAQSTQTTALQLIDNPIVAHDAAISGSTGVNVAGFNARSTDPTAVASADATQGLATLLGKLVVQPFAIPARYWSYAGPSGGITDTAEDTVLAAGGAGVRAYMTALQIINSDATVGTAVSILDGSGGTVMWRGYAAAAGGGISVVFPTPIRFTANTAVVVVCATTSSETYVNAQGYLAAE